MVAEIEATRLKYNGAKAHFETATNDRDQLTVRFKEFDRSVADRMVADADTRRAPLVAEHREIESKIADLQTAVVKDAKVLGATCTKAYLTVKEIGQFDIVIIDEASMVLLPTLWFVAGLTRERLVVCGDCRQIPPIVQTSQQAIYDVLGHDVFTETGLDNPDPDDTRCVMLETQYRMDEAICELISKPMYDGRLKTAKERTPATNKPPTPYDGTLTIIDTSELWPFESANAFFSRFNLMHALLARNLAWHFNRKGYIKSPDDLAICTPYTAQSKLIRKLLDAEEFKQLVQVGTVHRFQGDERNAIVLELPEGHGGRRMPGQFLQGLPPEQVGARLINVAVSRAKAHLIIIANLTYLDPLLPSGALLRGILCDMQDKGRMVPAADVLALRPIERDLQGLFGRAPLDLDAKTMGLFNESTAPPAIEADLSNAKKSIVIFSGFVTPTRVGKLGDLLRAKIADGVKVRCVTRPPNRNGTMDWMLGKSALDALEGIGCVVDCRAQIHQKVVLIDKEITWHGSLNVLSHTHLTDEIMTRVVNAGFAEALAADLFKRRVSTEKALKTLVDAENPRCERCGGRTFYDEGRYGPYFRCEAEGCGWSISLKQTGKQDRARANGDINGRLESEGPPCPQCGRDTRLRTGRFGPFYGCTKYPECKGTIDASPRRSRSKAASAVKSRATARMPNKQKRVPSRRTCPTRG
jgi:ssDNA-binding Zn-finger/Zn-ribbon topoisomerase 1